MHQGCNQADDEEALWPHCKYDFCSWSYWQYQPGQLRSCQGRTDWILQVHGQGAVQPWYYCEFRLGFARTRKEARQIVDHKFVTVNGKVVNIPSYLVKAGDVIEIKESKKNTQRMKDIVEVAGGRIVPEWLDVDAEKLQGTVKDLPTREQIDVPVDEMLIVELYSK